jgi:hypothetical protein
MSSRYASGPLIIAAAPGWLDITHEIKAVNVPFTLAKNDGVGALQFSTATYQSGKLPKITINTLRALLRDFALSREFGKGVDLDIREGPVMTCAQSYYPGMQFVRVWYCSNGIDVALVTYTCEKGLEQTELLDCEKMLRDLGFVRQ